MVEDTDPAWEWRAEAELADAAMECRARAEAERRDRPLSGQLALVELWADAGRSFRHHWEDE